MFITTEQAREMTIEQLHTSLAVIKREIKRKMISISVEIGIRLKTMRTQAGLDQYEASMICGISQGLFSMAENGQRPAAAVRICRTLQNEISRNTLKFQQAVRDSGRQGYPGRPRKTTSCSSSIASRR